MSHKVGSKVVCINDNFDDHIKKDPNFFQSFVNLPKKDEVYTIRTSEEGAVRLREVVNYVVPINLGDKDFPVWIEDEPAFGSHRFAPLLNNRDELTDSLLNDLFTEIEYDPEIYPHLAPEIEEDILVY